ncbi:MAG TPA: DUF4190 domain-containing protein [Pseudonocardiaceae bacterium]|nr:DUF4190 domain-containing protein [Pseudonocardiaceae bacterium]
MYEQQPPDQPGRPDHPPTQPYHPPGQAMYNTYGADNPMQPPYPQFGYYRPSTSGLSVAGMVIGILSLTMWWVPVLGLVISLVGLLLSARGIAHTRRGPRSGYGMGIAGLVCSLLSLIPAIVVAVFAVGLALL